MTCDNTIKVYINQFISGSRALAATMQGTGAVEATIKQAVKLAAEFQGIGSVDVQMKVANAASATLLAEGNVEAAMVVGSIMRSTMQGTGAVSAALKIASILQATLQGVGTLEAEAVAAARLSGTLAGTGYLEAAFQNIFNFPEWDANPYGPTEMSSFQSALYSISYTQADTTTTFGSVKIGGYQWLGGVLAPNG